MTEPENQRRDDKPGQPPFITRVGFFVFLGLVLGAAIGGFGYRSPVPGALLGAGVMLIIALVADFYGWRKRKRAERDKQPAATDDCH